MIKNILAEIVQHKITEVANAKQEISEEQLKCSPYFSREIISLRKNLSQNEHSGIIAEFKRKSPSKGWINQYADVKQVTNDYTKYGASCLSVLTDTKFFGGSNQDLLTARENAISILRKDFIIDEYQLLEAKSIGADVILLIAACLSPERTKELAKFAKDLGLEILLELHGEEELIHICEEVDFVGVNNRNLKTFEVDVDNSIKIMKSLPNNKFCIAESGIDNAEVLIQLKQAGFKGLLIGEFFMKNSDPGAAFKDYIKQIKLLEHES